MLFTVLGEWHNCLDLSDGKIVTDAMYGATGFAAVRNAGLADEIVRDLRGAWWNRNRSAGYFTWRKCNLPAEYLSSCRSILGSVCGRNWDRRGPGSTSRMLWCQLILARCRFAGLWKVAKNRGWDIFTREKNDSRSWPGKLLTDSVRKDYFKNINDSICANKAGDKEF